MEIFRYYYSNCLLESIIFKINDWKNIKLYKRGSWKEIFNSKFPHFYWYNKREDKYFHFSAKHSNLSFKNQLWFEGSIQIFHFHDRQVLAYRRL